MQKTIEQIESEFDAELAEFDAVMRRLLIPVRDEADSSPAYRVAQVIPFRREARQ